MVASRRSLGVALVLALVCFAANSVLARLALRDGGADPATFTGVRILAGAIVLAVLVGRRGDVATPSGSWFGAVTLVGYAAAFSFAYVRIDAAAGALVLFGAVQLTMVGVGYARGERLRGREIVGFATAAAGLVAFLLPSATAPDPIGFAWMVVAGACWGAYSLHGRGSRAPMRATAGNFVRAVPLAAAVVASAAVTGGLAADARSLALAVTSGAIASGLGYSLWYAVLPTLSASRAGLLQISVPILAALGGTLLAGESLSAHLLVCGAAVSVGIAIATTSRGK